MSLLASSSDPGQIHRRGGLADFLRGRLSYLSLARDQSQIQRQRHELTTHPLIDRSRSNVELAHGKKEKGASLDSGRLANAENDRLSNLLKAITEDKWNPVQISNFSEHSSFPIDHMETTSEDIFIDDGELRLNLLPGGKNATHASAFIPLSDLPPGDVRIDFEITYDEGSRSDLTVFFGASNDHSRFNRALNQSWSGYEAKFGGPGINETRIKKRGRNITESNPSPEYTTGMPYHFTVIQEGDSLRMYVNGELVSESNDQSPITSLENQQIGFMGYQFNGGIDNLIISQQAPSP